MKLAYLAILALLELAAFAAAAPATGHGGSGQTGRGGQGNSGGHGNSGGNGRGGNGGSGNSSPTTHVSPSSRPSSHPKREPAAGPAVLLPLGTRGDLARCPADSVACPAAVGSDEWECVHYEDDLYSCGGCLTLGTGADCTALANVLAVGCEAAACVVYTCERGYTLVDGACVTGLVTQ
ncbi:hypothetical protein Q5752_004691 [Cryptotrichosporon argae]